MLCQHLGQASWSYCMFFGQEAKVATNFYSDRKYEPNGQRFRTPPLQNVLLISASPDVETWESASPGARNKVTASSSHPALISWVERERGRGLRLPGQRDDERASVQACNHCVWRGSILYNPFLHTSLPLHNVFPELQGCATLPNCGRQRSQQNFGAS